MTRRSEYLNTSLSIVLFIAVALCSVNAHAGFTGPAYISGSSNSHIHTPDIAEGPDGKLHVTWQSDAFDNGSRISSSIMYSVSEDGGTTWSAPVAVNTFYERWAIFERPKAAVDKDGAIHLVYDYLHGYGWGYMIYSRSADGGSTWSHSYLQNACFLWDGNPGVDENGGVYIAWSLWACGSSGYTNTVFFSRSLDDGLTMSQPAAVIPGQLLTNRQPGGDVRSLLVDRSGTLHVLYASGAYSMNADGYLTSADRGQSWQPVTSIPTGFVPRGISESGTAILLSGFYNSGSAVVRSLDGGATWEGPFMVADTQPYYSSQIVTSSTNTNLSFTRLNTTLYRSDDKGTTWTPTDTIVYTPTKMIYARDNNFLFVGIFDGLVGVIRHTDDYTVTPAPGPNGGFSPSSAQTVTYQNSTSFTIIPDTGYHIDTVSGCGGTLNGNMYTTAAITNDCTVTATFAISTYTVTPSSGFNGSISPYTAQTVTYGNSTSFTIIPDTGYHIDTVSGCGGTLDGSTHTTGAIAADCWVTPTFAINTYAITASAGADGNISPSGAVAVNYGGSQGYTITPNTGYHVADVLVDGVSVGAVSLYTFSNVTADHSISASFEINIYTISAVAGSNGAISPAGDMLVNYGGSQTFAITPNTGYMISDVLVDGASIGPVTSHTFSNVSAGHTIFASFGQGVSGSCMPIISPRSSLFLAQGGTGTVNVSVDSQCGWTATSDSAWITVANGSGTGSGTLTYSVSQNQTHTRRTGTVTISGKTFSVMQLQ